MHKLEPVFGRVVFWTPNRVLDDEEPFSWIGLCHCPCQKTSLERAAGAAALAQLGHLAAL